MMPFIKRWVDAAQRRSDNEVLEAGDRDALVRGHLELGSATWYFIKNYVSTEIAVLREQNDKPLDADRTAAIRGQIKALKKVLALEKGSGHRPKNPAGDAGEEDDV